MQSKYQGIKCVFLGNSGVGKTALCNRYLNKKFENVYQTTIGCSFHAKQYQINDKLYGLEIWDTAGQERYRSILPMYYRNTDIAFICFDLTQDSYRILESIDHWVRELEKYNDNDKRLYYLVGTKKDLVEQETIDSIFTDIKKYYLNKTIFVTSSKNNEGVEEIFDISIRELLLKKDLMNNPSVINLSELPTKQKGKKKCC